MPFPRCWELDHPEVQGALIQWFRNHAKEWNSRPLTEIRLALRLP
jgi:hypothetical protein